MKLGFLFVLAIAIAFTPLGAYAQHHRADGYWGTCIDPNGDEAKCWKPGSPSREQSAMIVINQKIKQNFYISAAPTAAPRQVRYSARNSARYDDDDNVVYDHDEPVYQTQRVRTVRKGCTFGKGEYYYGGIYWKCTFGTETTTIDVVSNDLTFRPNIVVRQPYNYYHD